MGRSQSRALAREDEVFLGLGVLILIASFLPWYGYRVSGDFFVRHGPSISWSTNAWTGWTALGLILMLIATALVAVELMTDLTLPELQVSWGVVILALDALGALIIVIRSLDQRSVHGLGVSVGLRWGGWILLFVALAQVVVAGLRFRASGERMPWAAGGAEPFPSSSDI